MKYYDANAGTSGVFIVGWNKNRWTVPLPASAQAPLGRARKATDRMTVMATCAVRNCEPDRLKALEEALAPFYRVLAQDESSRGAPGSSIEKILALIEDAGGRALELIENLPSAHGEGGTWLVPDANALIWKSDLREWRTSAPASLIIVPRVIAELDDIKNRDGSAAEKAQKVIRQLNECDRRGDTFAGVPVVGNLSLREVAVEPQFDDAPEWLSKVHPDDQIVASTLELAWSDLSADITLVTRDRNLKNKARFAGLQVSDVDEIPALRVAEG